MSSSDWASGVVVDLPAPQGVEILVTPGNPGGPGPQGRGIDDIGVDGVELVFAMSDETTERVEVPALSDAVAAADTATGAAGTATAAAGVTTAQADIATTKAGQAAASAEASEDLRAEASQAADDAGASALIALSASTNANTRADDAALSASNANASQQQASADAADAQVAAGIAGGHAAAASSSRTNAATSESNAHASELAAAQSALDAAAVVNDGVPNATASVKGGIRLGGDLAGTWDAPTVPGLAGKADLVDGKVPSSQIPAVALSIPVPVFDEAARLALTTSQVQPGDVAIQASPAGTWMLKDPDPSDPDSWVAFVTPESPVQSVNGQTGTVVLGKGDVGLGSVDNTPDAAKPVSSAQQTALDGKVPTTRTIASGTGLSGGGDLTVNRTLAVQYGVTSGTACQGNDSRLSDARTPTAHTHAATDITSGTLDAARIPNLAASKITSGTLDAARIPSITSAMITDGTIVDADISASAGIAKTKLASGVQTSLDKADSASQLVITKVANEAAWNSGPKTAGVLYYWTA